MNKPLVLLSIVALGFGAVVYFEEQRASELERLAESMHVGNTELSALCDRNREEISSLRGQIQIFKTEAEELRRQLAAKRVDSGTAGPDSASVASAGGQPQGGQQFMKGLAKMFTDPEMKKSMRVQQMVGIRMLYGDLTKELGLSAADAEQLMEILADRQMDVSASAMGNMDPSSPDKGKQEKKLAETQERYREQLKSVLGEERYKQFQSYEGSIGDRFMLQQFEGQFAATGAPLEASQKEKLLGLMREERTKTAADRISLMNNTNPQQQMEALKSDEAMGKFVTSQEDFNRRVLNRARDVLNADQVAALEKVQQQQLDLMKVQVKMSRELLGAGK